MFQNTVGCPRKDQFEDPSSRRTLLEMEQNDNNLVKPHEDEPNPSMEESTSSSVRGSFWKIFGLKNHLLAML